jgi:hypothetical protein
MQVEEDQVLVDNNMRREWEAAKNEKERTEALVATSKSALEDLSHIIDGSMVELAQSAEEYARLSLSGSFSAPLEKAIWLLEQRCKGMEEKGVGLELLAKVRSSLEQMKERLDLLRKAKQKAREAVQRIEEKVQEKSRKAEETAQEIAQEQAQEQAQEKAEDGDRKIEQWKFEEEIQEGAWQEGAWQEGAWQEGAWNFWEIVREKVRTGFWG